MTPYSVNSARTSDHFSAMLFRKTRKMSDGVLSVLRAKFDAVFGILSPNLSSFFGDVFSQDKASKPPPYMHTARRKKRSFTGSSARNLKSFFGLFFRKTREMSDGVLSVLRAKFDAVFGKLSPNLSPFFGDVFSQDKENKRRRTSVLQAKFDAVFGKLSPETSNHFSVMFFRKTRKISADVQAYFKRNLTQYCGKTARKIRFP